MMRAPTGSLHLTPSHKSAVLAVLRSNQLSPGTKCQEFEKAFAVAHGARHGLFVNSGTDALRIALSALKEKYAWKDGDEVIVPSLTFVASVNTILQVGLKPFFVDVSMYDFNLNAYCLERLLQTAVPDRIRAIMPVHLFGTPCDMRHIQGIARKHNLKIIEDSCETMGINKLKGDVACFSTYVCHLMTTGVGGLAITNDTTLSWLMRSYANHGRHVDYIPGYQKTKDIRKRFRFDRIGYSSRPTEIEAALGLEELKLLPSYIRRRQQLAARLFVGLDRIDELCLPLLGDYAYMMFPVVLREGSRVSKWSLMRFLEKRGIETREMLPLINQPCYKRLGINPSHFPVTDWINRNGFYIGCHPGMKDEDIPYIVDAFRRFFHGKAN